ncbi:OmpA family protein [Kaistia dalseonensis]|uniref:Outer membrane protein OmpA-like peptidoglycan-associated protein n=1 Tax=Kaistia dalseonensis TaxID=410840 RepID=A0ABU0H3Z0_9HYPH|nr:OmpA family protein [Kaistia dalseonensis]MCX5493667.1 OmpA family protein [Kaistia dalseonensis]MDQ0436229.1 outer membrane protein OmpA-like peptidoglycan-associated protein [Kaistia dalseonensis]
MRLPHLLLSTAALQIILATMSTANAAENAAGTIVVAQAENNVASAQRSLEAAEKSLQDAEDTGGDIRAARKALANAMKSLRAAEAAAGVPPGAAAPTPPAEQPKPTAPASAQPAPSAEAPASPPPAAPASPKPYQPPAVKQTAPAKPDAAKPAPAKSPSASPTPEKPAAGASAPKPAPAKPVAPPVEKSAAPREQPAKPKAPSAPPRAARPGGEIMNTYPRPNGYRIVEWTSPDGQLIRRIEIDPMGNETVLIDTERPVRPDPRYVDPFQVPPPPGYVPPPGPGRGYVLNGDQAGEAEIENTLRAAPVRRFGRGYSLNEIRRDARIRDMVGRVDLDTITFETGSARVPDDQVNKLRSMGRALGRILDRSPNEVFLIEGHTDAVGSDAANLDLSDRRAASVAGILSRYFDIPPRNLVTQGYGEQYLKIPTDGPERQNRRVTVRRITPLLNGY